jgi:exonuclease III
VRDLFVENIFDFICVQETMAQDFSDAMLRKVDPNRNYLWDWSPAKGKSGGILIGLKLDTFDVGMRTQGDFILMHKLWDKRLEVKWCIMNVYGAAQEDQRESFLRELASVCSGCSEPYIAGGDFNILRFSFEKNKMFSPNRFSDMFNSVITTFDLSELQMSRGYFTWSNGQENPTLEKLDRILVTRSWEMLFPTALVHKIPRDYSDHNPLIMVSGNQFLHRGREFRFELAWLDHNDFYVKS